MRNSDDDDDTLAVPGGLLNFNGCELSGLPRGRKSG